MNRMTRSLLFRTRALRNDTSVNPVALHCLNELTFPFDRIPYVSRRTILPDVPSTSAVNQACQRSEGERYPSVTHLLGPYVPDVYTRPR